MEFKNKVVLITGASSGIGRATALLFSKHEAILVLTGRNKTNLELTAVECRQNTSEVLGIVADLTKSEEINGLIEKTIKNFKKLDILINNAGVIAIGGIEETNVEQYDEVFNTNVRAVYQLTNAAVPYLITTKGNIVNVSSVMGLRAAPGSLAYCMSKAAIDQFTKCVALDLAPKGVRVNAVNPGVIVTELHLRGGMGEAQYADFLEKCKISHALGRPGRADEVAEAIAYLAGNGASFITGTLLSVDGGRHVMCPR